MVITELGPDVVVLLDTNVVVAAGAAGAVVVATGDSTTEDPVVLLGVLGTSIVPFEVLLNVAVLVEATDGVVVDGESVSVVVTG